MQKLSYIPAKGSPRSSLWLAVVEPPHAISYTNMHSTLIPPIPSSTFTQQTSMRIAKKRQVAFFDGAWSVMRKHWYMTPVL
jgi:hypothetical protein